MYVVDLRAALNSKDLFIIIYLAYVPKAINTICVLLDLHLIIVLLFESSHFRNF